MDTEMMMSAMESDNHIMPGTSLGMVLKIGEQHVMKLLLLIIIISVLSNLNRVFYHMQTKD